MSEWWAGMTYSEWQAEDRRRRQAKADEADRRKVEPMYELVGQRVLRVLVNDVKDVIVFETSDEPIAFLAAAIMGEAWFADVTGLDELRGHVVTGCEYIDIQGQEDERSRTDVEEFYGVRLKTDAGTTDIVFRCSYDDMAYSGSITGTVDPPDDLTELTGDEWSA